MNNKESKYDISGINKNTYDLLFKDENLPLPINDTKKKDKILDEIAVFTTFRENNLYDKIKKKIYEYFFHIDFSKISYDEENKKYNYNCEDKVIEFEKFSDSISGSDSNKLKKELLSSRREGKCHEMAIKLIGGFQNPVTILTGTYERHGKKYLHSVIELYGKENTYIVDYTLNLIMLKEQYIELAQFEEIESIKDIEIMEDYKNGIQTSLEDIKAKQYLTFRKELKENLQKNKFMLQETKDEELDKRIEEIKKQREDFERE